MVTNVYVDGPNLHYGLLRRGGWFRWLDLRALAQLLLPGSQLHDLYYFTVPVKDSGSASNLSPSHEAYLRALRTLPGLKIERGRSITQVVQVPDHARGVPVAVLRQKQKGVDVRLATTLLRDAYEGRCRRAAIISDDSDLVPAVTIAAQKLPDGVHVFNPSVGDSGAELRSHATVYKYIRLQDMKACQFPDEVTSTGGKTITRPENWWV